MQTNEQASRQAAQTAARQTYTVIGVLMLIVVAILVVTL